MVGATGTIVSPLQLIPVYDEKTRFIWVPAIAPIAFAAVFMFLARFNGLVPSSPVLLCSGAIDKAVKIYSVTAFK